MFLSKSLLLVSFHFTLIFKLLMVSESACLSSIFNFSASWSFSSSRSTWTEIVKNPLITYFLYHHSKEKWNINLKHHSSDFYIQQLGTHVWGKMDHGTNLYQIPVSKAIYLFPVINYLSIRIFFVFPELFCFLFQLLVQWTHLDKERCYIL